MDATAFDHLAGLCKLRLTTADRDRLAPQLERILALFDELAALPTDGIEPSHYPMELPCPLRADAAEPPQLATDLVELGPGAGGGFFRVPRVIEG